jgi:hypothetical protein
MVEERAGGTHCTSAIQLSGGSWPDRVKGFNRFGMTQEVARHEGGALVESAYLSFMTSSPEKNTDQAWQAFADRSRALNLAVARGTATRSAYASELEHLTAPEGSTWMDCPGLMTALRNAAGSRQSTLASEQTERAYPTFLHAVRAAILARRGNSQCTFMHNASLYGLHTTLADSVGIKLLTGRVTEPAHNSGSRGESYFRIWFRSTDASSLPSRIEFRPRSFLRLVFEEDATAGGPALPCLIPQEGV